MLMLPNQFSPLRRVTAVVIAVVMALPMLGTAPAQAAVDELITTTARGRSEAVRDVPASIAVITQDDIEALGIQRVEDFVNLVPGVTIVNSAEVADTQINIRGINGARDAENSIALVIDGILMTNPAAVNREYTNLQQIEIVKGPQGALYGRNAAAGAIIITTLQPGEEFGARFRGTAADDSSYMLMGNLSGPAGDSVGWSVGADFRTTDGFYSDVFTGLDDETDSFESYNVDGRLIWDVTDTWALDAKFRYGEVDANAITFNSVFQLPVLSDVFGLDPAFNEDVNEHPFQFNSNTGSSNDQETTEFSIRSTSDLGWAELTAWGLYSNVDNSLSADGTSGAFGFFFQDQLCRDSTNALAGFPLGAPQYFGLDPANGAVPEFPDSVYGAYTPTTCDGTQYQERNQEDISFEIRLTSQGDQRFRWSAGLYYLSIDREVGVNTGIDSGTGIVESLYIPNGGVSGVNNATEQLVHDQFDSDVFAVFGQIAYDITDTFEAALAVRWDQEERDARSLVPTVADGATAEFINCGLTDPYVPFTDPINPGLCPDVNPSGTFEPRSKTFDELQPKISLTWDIFPTLTAYTSIGVGFKSGGFNNQGSEATVDKWINSYCAINDVAGCLSFGAPIPTDFSEVGITDDYRKETSTSYELGFKSTVGSLHWEGAIYHVDVDDMQFFEFFVGPFGLLRVVENIDDVDMDGVEISAQYSPTDGVTLFGGFNWIDSEINEAAVRPDTVGNQAPYTPDWTANFGASILVPMSPSLNFIGSFDFSGVGKTWFHVVQDQERPTGAPAAFTNAQYGIAERDEYWLVNARLGVGGDNWSVVAFGRNLTDEAWLQEIIPAPEFGGSFTHPGTLSRYGIEATYQF